MNILLLTSHFNTGGITSYALTLSEGICRLGHRVIVVSAGGDAVGLLEKTGAVHVRMDIRVKSEAHPKLYVALPALVGLVRREKIEIIHAQTRVTQVMAFWLSCITGKAFVSTCHGFFRPRWFRRTFPCWGRGVIAVSQGVRTHLIKDFKMNPERVHLIPNGIDLSHYPMTDEALRRQKREEWSIQGNPVIGIIARLSEVKGIHVLISAMPRVARQLPQAHLYIVGEGPQEKELKALVERHGVAGHVTFKNAVQRTAEILPCFDVFVMPSLQEGLGLAVMEAMAAGIPVVASNVGGLPELIKDDETGLLAIAGHTAALSSRLLDMCTNPNRLQMAKAARNLIETTYNAQDMVARTIKFYEQYSRR